MKQNPAYEYDYVLSKLLELTYDGIVVVDATGIITLISKAYTDFLGISEKDAIGKHVNDVIENTRLPIALKTGKTEKAQLHLINGNYMVASRYPLIKDGQIVGAIGKVLFQNINDLNVLHKRINDLQNQLENFQSKANRLGQAKYSFQNIIGESDKLLLAKTMAQKGALTDSSILLLGESGTGKELFAHAIHQESVRAGKPFIKVNCAAIPQELLESELFGYKGGAFTGALKGGKMGKFETADGGTIFLDEIGDMPKSMQSKLLRVLQEKEIEKIGAQYPLSVDVRIIAATNKNLEELTAQGDFRADLFYRLNVFGIKIPSLRERPEDIDILIPYLLNKICSRMGKYVENISSEAIKKLNKYSWPGNIRELENVLERAVNLIGKEGVIESKHLSEKIGGQVIDNKITSLEESLQKCEIEVIEKAIAITKGNKAKAARLLNISRSKLYERLSKLNM
ncbi:MAG: sigma 54-interacting transcriptional regulator [Victivallaceae bacterium]|nr:sigma 54-interacting transcriptional regulator [Victivallaceae bacterium]